MKSVDIAEAGNQNRNDMGELWEAFLDVALPLGPLHERQSRFADKPALFIGNREIAHCEDDGHIDLRITSNAWRALRESWRDDPAVDARSGRRDWINLVLASPADAVRLEPLVSAAVTANQ